MSHDLEFDRAYDAETHLWVAFEGNRARVGFDPLGRETSGDIVAMSFLPVGAEVTRAAEFGTLEAAKFVGPLKAPVTGRMVGHNDELLTDPGKVADAPFEHWLVEIEVDDVESARAELLTDADEIRAWYDREDQRFRDQGMIAE